MEPDKNYLFVGVFLVSMLLAMLGFIVWLAGNDAGNYDTYQMFVSESVTGLSEGSLVKYRGVNVGKVNVIEISKSNPAKIRIQMDILDTTPLTTSTVAVIQIQGITGVSYIDLKGHVAKGQPPIALKGKNKLPIIPSAPSEFRQIVDTIPDMLQKFTELANKLGAFASDENQTRFHNILSNFEKFSKDVGEHNMEGRTLIQDLHQAVRNLGDAAATIQDISTNSRADIERVLNTAVSTLDRVNSLTVDVNNYGEKSYQEVQRLLLDIKKTSRDIQSLSRNLKEDPSQIIYPSREDGVKIK